MRMIFNQKYLKYIIESFKLIHLYYARKIKELINNFNQNIKSIQKEDILRKLFC